ncbi:MAG: sensor histidine kinase [Blastococcus sp.]
MTTTGLRRNRWTVDALVLVGVASLVALGALAAHTGVVEVLPPSALATAFLVAGALGGWARPDHPGIRLLLAVGAAHLVAFATTGWVGTLAGVTGWWTWGVVVGGDAAYVVGFVLLALLLATYPGGRLSTAGLRRFAALSGTAGAMAMLAEAVLQPRVGLALETGAASVPAPPPLPLATGVPRVVDLVPVLVVVGAGVLLVRSRSLAGPERGALGWAKVAGSLLALMLAATPIVSGLVPSAVWDLAFVVVVSTVPFLLLGGLVRYRLLQVDVYLVRTIGRGVVVLAVLGAYASASAAFDGTDAVAASIGLTVLAALTGVPVMNRVQVLADRWLTGGRIRYRAVLDRLVDTLAVPDSDRLGERICHTVAEGLEVAWVRLSAGEHRATAGRVPADAVPELTVALRTAGAEVGTLECGPRRGGWGRTERAQLESIGTPTALALRDAELTAELSARVTELTASRALLVQVEQSVRRQIERDLHDGAQQQLVALLARLGIARALLDEASTAADPLAAAHDLAQQCLRDLRELVAGLYPALLGARGLIVAVEARASLMPIPVAVDSDPRIADARFPAEVESAAFFVVSEALANVLKHSGSERARVILAPLSSGGLRVAVTDEGSGTATYGGSGLEGLRARVEALGGRFLLQATPSVGTTVIAEFTVDAPAVAGV